MGQAALAIVETHVAGAMFLIGFFSRSILEHLWPDGPFYEGSELGSGSNRCLCALRRGVFGVSNFYRGVTPPEDHFLTDAWRSFCEETVCMNKLVGTQ
jgi:hypothetical protein